MLVGSWDLESRRQRECPQRMVRRSGRMSLAPTQRVCPVAVCLGFWNGGIWNSTTVIGEMKCKILRGAVLSEYFAVPSLSSLTTPSAWLSHVPDKRTR